MAPWRMCERCGQETEESFEGLTMRTLKRAR